jgi:hypothetical protein
LNVSSTYDCLTYNPQCYDSESIKPLSNPLFSLLPELPKRPKQKNSCFKMWLIDQLYIGLGYNPLIYLPVLMFHRCQPWLEIKKKLQSVGTTLLPKKLFINNIKGSDIIWLIRLQHKYVLAMYGENSGT